MQWHCRMEPYRFILAPGAGKKGQVVRVDCKQWQCAEHVGILRWRWLERLSRIPWTTLGLLTLVPPLAGAVRNKTTRVGWRRVVRWLRRSGYEHYVRVAETKLLSTGQLGVHWHILLSGQGYLPGEVLSQLAVGGGFGLIVGLSRIRSVGHAIGYVLKYCLKAESETLNGQRRIATSRGVPTWPQLVRAGLVGHPPITDIRPKWTLVPAQVAEALAERWKQEENPRSKAPEAISEVVRGSER